MSGSAVARAAAAVAVAVRALPRPAGDDDDDERDPDAPVIHISLDMPTLTRLGRRFPLTPVYREFLAAHSSHDFVAAGLRLGARPTSIAAAPLVEELTDLHREARGWAPRWLVCALAADGCYVLELDAPRGDDCPVLFVPAEERGKVEPAAGSFVAFLEQVARDSRPPPPGRERAVPRDRSEGAAERTDAPRERPGWVVPAALAALAALIWWLRS
jgi:hypothetical protein